MKLKKKMILIVAIATVMGVILSGTLLLMALHSSIFRSAYESADLDMRSAYSAFTSRVDAYQKEGPGKEASDARLSLGYRDVNNWKNLIFHGGTEVYNLTVFRLEELNRAAYTGKNVDSSERYAHREELTYEDGRYIVNKEMYEDYQFFHLTDITDVYTRLREYMLFFALIGGGVLLVVIFASVLAMRHVLSPLKELTEAAQRMTEGDYSQRIPARSKDELGVLAENFNHMADAVEREQRNLQESEYKKTLMMGNLSHELRTPMTAISGYAETLLTTKLSEEQKEEALAYIYDETRRLQRLSGKMLQLLGLAEGEAVEKKQVPTDELFSGIRETLAEKAESKGVRLILEEDGEPMNTDEDLIRDVIINLTDNAIKACSDGGSVKVLWKNGVLQVQDDGVGIPPEELDSVTEPFYMVDKSRARKEGGAGLGLSITKMILERLGTTLRIESEVGKGTTVTVEGLTHDLHFVYKNRNT